MADKKEEIEGKMENKMSSKEEKIQELIKKYKIDLEKLEQEQEKLAKQLDIKDIMDFSLAEKIAGISNSFSGSKIISAIVICNRELEILEQDYYIDKVTFPYIPGFRAYRELPVMLRALDKLEDRPDIIFIPGHGICHPRLGLASHFSIASGIPSIGIANSLFEGQIKGQDIILNGKKVGKILESKPGSRPIYISPGNKISIDTSLKLSKELIRLPHKMPEPLHLAKKYVNKVRKEVGV